MKQLGYICRPSTPMVSNNLDDAMYECSDNPTCFWFYEFYDEFHSCNILASFDANEGYALYKKGNYNILAL